MTVLRPQLYPNEGSSEVTEPEASAITQVPLSAGQRGLWLAQKLSPDVPISEAQYIELRGDLDVDLLRTVTIRAGREFQSGYLRLEEVGGEPYQFFDPSLEDAGPLIDVRGAPDPVATGLEWMRREYTTPLDMTRDRLVITAVVQVGDRHYLLYTRIHHVAFPPIDPTYPAERIIYFSAAAHPKDNARPVLAWNNLVTGRITDHRIPIRHERMIEPDSLRAIGFVLTEHFRSLRTTAPEPNTPTRTSR
ncbi:condensation domain-containing protein [Nocardia sp. NPDC051990]|uniref:condensation domain-containing protein n=1 Tax=Nocardia sp. NPDC051990 TaxID=3155285 RepID=UPI00343E4F2B